MPLSEIFDVVSEKAEPNFGITLIEPIPVMMPDAVAEVQTTPVAVDARSCPGEPAELLPSYKIARNLISAFASTALVGIS